ncbi:MAG: phage tail sheath subtilisin-like domain-containing protein [Acetobacteraceae bacterium]|jgi:phage tail sheath protein FI
MSGSYSYPGIYIQELPSSSHAIVPAPTSIAAFIGYSHPYKTANFGVAQQLFSFSDYETYFGGLFSSGLIDASLPRAVYQFFLNGGSTAYVVGLQPGLFKESSTTETVVDRLGTGTGNIAPTSSTVAATGGGFSFTAREPIDAVPMSVSITNVRNGNTTFDIIITYGNQVETWRGATIPTDPAHPKPTDPNVMINGVSALVTVTPSSTGFGSALTTVPVPPITWTDVSTTASTFITGYDGGDFLPVFAANSSLDNVEIFNLLLIPGVTDNEVVSAALAFAERKRAFAIIDPPPQAPAVAGTVTPPAPIDAWMNAGVGGTTLPMSQNGALYFPYLRSTDPVTGQIIPMAPSGFVAGIYAATDASRGVWKAPAGLATVVLNTTGPVLSGIMNDPQQGVLNIDSINCLRSFAGTGTVVWGARTLVAKNQAYQQSMYVPVRRMTLFIEQTLLANLRWVVFEPNDEPLWVAIKSSIEAFLLSLFRQGGLQGSTPSDAFQVKCDSTTTSPTDQQNGIVNIVVAFAPLKPAEFVVIKIAQLAGQTAGS